MEAVGSVNIVPTAERAKKRVRFADDLLLVHVVEDKENNNLFDPNFSPVVIGRFNPRKAPKSPGKALKYKKLLTAGEDHDLAIIAKKMFIDVEGVTMVDPEQP